MINNWQKYWSKRASVIVAMIECCLVFPILGLQIASLIMGVNNLGKKINVRYIVGFICPVMGIPSFIAICCLGKKIGSKVN